MATDVSVGSLPVMANPPAVMPFPASSLHQLALSVAVHSVASCAPYFCTEKPQLRVRSFGAQPIIGTVSSTSLPLARASSMNRSDDDPFGSASGSSLSLG